MSDEDDFERAQRLLAEKRAQRSGKVQPIRPGVAVANGIGRLADLLSPAIDRAAARSRGEELPVPTQFDHLNHTLGGGLWPGNHFLVAGTGVGKSQWTFQLALHAAEAGVPVGLIALELDEMSLAIRVAAEKCGVVWSKVYNGQASHHEMAAIRATVPLLSKLDIRTDFGQAMGWGYDRLELMAKELRATKKKGPVLIVLDFIQLIAAPADKDGKTRHVDLRERIGTAGYVARNVAKTYDASIIIISSTARQNYGALNERLSKTGLTVEQSGRRIVRYPDNLIGLGKESGELEFSADSLTVLMRPTLTAGQHDDVITALLARGSKVVACVTPKVRAGIPSWFAMGFEHGRFTRLEESTINSLCRTDEPEDEESSTDAADAKVLAAIKERHATDATNPYTTQAEIAKAIGLSKSKVNRALSSLVEDQYIERIGKGYVLKAPL